MALSCSSITSVCTFMKFLNRRITAQFVRIFPLEYQGERALQFNVLGCNPSAPPNQDLFKNPTAEPKTDEFGWPMLKPGQTRPQGTPTPSPKTDAFGNPILKPGTDGQSIPTTPPAPKPSVYKEPPKGITAYANYIGPSVMTDAN